jgi:hypothetical protein
VPKEKLYEQIEQIQYQDAAQDYTAKIAGVGTGDKWIELGPTNRGGRVRALTILSDNKTAFAGGISGGLWTCSDITMATPYWRRVNDYWDNLNISCIAKHPTNGNVILFGTGEGFKGSLSSNDRGAAILKGGGIWLSTNKGQTWLRLFSTTIGSDFNFIQKIVIDNTGYVYVATMNGLFRSNNVCTNSSWSYSTSQGAGWTEVLGSANMGITADSKIADIEIASNGTLFASNGAGAGNTNAANIYRSNNGINWVQITGKYLGALTFGTGRIELATTPNQPNRLFATQSGRVRRLDNALTVQDSIGGGTSAKWKFVKNFPNGENQAGYNANYHTAFMVSPYTTTTTQPTNIQLYIGFENIWKLKADSTTNITQTV